MKVTRQDLLAPANALTLAGFGLVVYGCVSLDSLTGLMIVAAGRTLDIFDGHVARRTHTSDFGSLFDATLDKFALLFILLALAQFHLVWTWLLLLIFIHHIFSGLINLYAGVEGVKPRSLIAGKYAMFGENIVLFLLTIATLLGRHKLLIHPLHLNVVLQVVAVGLLPIVAYFIVKSLYDYVQRAKRATIRHRKLIKQRLQR